VVPWEKATLFGNMIAEAPLVRDYLAKTNGSFRLTGRRRPGRRLLRGRSLARRHLVRFTPTSALDIDVDTKAEEIA
jgi:hypothetical protein